MSGPKINRYSLSPEARKNLDEQIRCEQQSIACAKQVKKMLRELLDSRGTVEDELAKLRIIHRRTGGCGEEISALEHFLSDFEEDALAIEAALRDDIPVQSRKYVLTADVLQKKKAQLTRLKKLKQQVLSYSGPLGETLAVCQKMSAAKTAAVQKDIAADLSAGVSFDIPVKADTALQDEKDAVLAQLTALFLRADCPGSMKDPLQNAVQSLERISAVSVLQTFRSVTVDPLVKRYEEAVLTEAKAREKQEELTARYTALCELVGTEAKAIPGSMLEEAIRQLEQQMVRDREQEYIAACLDEVMTEMGYDLIGSRAVTKKSGRRFQSELYTFSEGTAVNVTYSSDGQIAMELGGIARTDRLPTDAEAEVLVEDMESFCADFAEIERRLAAKGVVPGTRIAMAPPTAEYAAIINLADYDVAAGKQVAEMQVSVKQKTDSAKKSMHRGDE